MTTANRRVLLLFAHPAFERSRANRALIAAARDVEGVNFHDLYEAYPTFDIDVEAEQRLLIEHDTVVLQHPLYWYSTPALVKEWFDLVLQHGWAYGSAGRALHGKRLLTATTAGGSEAAYCHEGTNRFTLRELLAPIEQTAQLCGMRYLDPFALFGTLGLDDAALAGHAERYRQHLVGLVAGDDDGHR